MAGDRAKILIADDQPEVLDSLSVICTAEGFETATVTSPAEAVTRLAEEHFDLVLMDMNYHSSRTTGEDGLQLLQEIRRLDPSLPVIVMTAYGSIPLAISAVRLGANDFLEKPWENERLLSIIRTQIQLRAAVRRKELLEAENQVLKRAEPQIEGFVALSPAMKQVQQLIEQVAPSDANILITGENGTGKGVVASLLHRLSQRTDQPMLTINMGGISENLFESEMFGHVKGAFTDARTDRTGRFELADRGTLFLDEIANLTLTQQAKILRVLETGEFERLGSSKTKKVDVRMLSATNADLSKEIAAGRFREDLYFRLNTIQIQIPPLRGRAEDILALARSYLKELCRRYRKNLLDISKETLETLRRYSWPGNVRELRHVMERAVLLCRTPEILPGDLGLQNPGAVSTQIEDLDLEAVEAQLIRKALERAQGNAVLAAKTLGLSRSAFYRRLQKYKESGFDQFR